MSDPTALVATFGTGPAVKEAAYHMAKTGASIVFIRVADSARDAVISDPAITGADLTATLSGTPTKPLDVIVRFTAVGTVGTDALSYRMATTYDRLGNPEFGSVVTTSAGADTIVVSGVTITLGTGDTIAINDEVRFYAVPASASLLAQTTTKSNTSSPSVGTMVASGTPADAYDVVFEIRKGGTPGTFGMTWRASLDGGNSFGPERQLGTATTVELMDEGASGGGTKSTGLTVTLSNALDTGDKLTFGTTAPEWDAGSFSTAMDALVAMNRGFGFVRAVGVATPAGAGTIGGKMATLDTANDLPSFALVASRSHALGVESKIQWAQRTIQEWASFADTRVAVSAGSSRISCPLTGRRDRRHVACVATPEIVNRGRSVSIARKMNGPLSSDVKIHDDNSRLAEHDARLDESLNAEGFLTLRTFAREAGVYFTRDNMKSPQGSDFQRITYRRIMDAAEVVYQKEMERFLQSGLRPQRPTDPNPGRLFEEDANILDREIGTAIRAEIGDEVVEVQVAVDRTMDFASTGKLKAKVRIVPLTYLDEFEGEISYVNPSKAAGQTA